MTILINKGQSNTFALDNLDNKALTVGFSYVFEFINGQSKQSQKLTIAPTTTSNVSEFVLVEGVDITFANKGSYEYILREDDTNELCRGKMKVVGVNTSKPSPTLNKTYVVYEQ
jgi:hypothetical protein